MEKSFEWIMSAINTSVSRFHLDCCEILLDLFISKYGDEARVLHNKLLHSLIEKTTFLNIEA